MSIIVLEDGSGVAGANAYVDAAFFASYFAQVGVDLTEWDQARTEQRIILATRYMTTVYRDRWQGRRIDYIQALDWPRYGVLLSLGDNTGVWYPGYGEGYATQNSVVPQNVVPPEVKAACCEFAFRADISFGAGEQGGVGTLMPDLAAGAGSIIQKTVGPVTVRYEPGQLPVPVYTYANALLRPYLRPGDTQTQLVRG